MEKCKKCKKIIEEYPHTCKDKYLDDYEHDKGGDAYDSGGDYGDGEDLSQKICAVLITLNDEEL